ncbi:MAG: hypothetical protein ACYDHP_04810 [Ferrimicrobium sp.]
MRRGDRLNTLDVKRVAVLPEWPKNKIHPGQPDYITVVLGHPADLFEPIMRGMLAETKQKESERLRECLGRIHPMIGTSSAGR